MKSTENSRRYALRIVATALAMPLAPLAFAGTQKPLIEIWKNPACICCKDWVAHLETNGFTTEVNETDNSATRSKLGVVAAYASCHTAQVEGYAIEGHVPAADIRRLLKERPDAIGLAVPGMVVGSPGMDGPAYGGQHDPYTVLLLSKSGGATVYESHQ